MGISDSPPGIFILGLRSVFTTIDFHLWAFQAIIVFFSLTFRVTIITFQFRRSGPSPCFQLRRSEPSSIFRSTFRVASSVSALRVIITSQFDVQSHHHHFLVSAFRAIIGFQIDIQSPLLEPSSIFRLTFRVASSVSAFRVIITSQFDVQSHHYHFLVSTFRAIIDFQIDIQSRILGFGVQSRYHFSSFYFLSLVLRVGLVILSHNSWSSCPLALRVLPSGFGIRPRLSSLRYLVLIAYSSRSPHRIVPFGRILAHTPGWFDRYSSLTLISWVTFGDILEREWILCPYGGLFGSSVEFTSLHSLFTLTFHSIVHVPYTQGSQVGCSRAARWDIRGTEELGTGGFFFRWLAKEAKGKRKEKKEKSVGGRGDTLLKEKTFR
ncbi:hypothetical protein CK203_079723 [Vitis vinifera]|uniref:Uncharacterized protein n=1 Tax=Vitis vinifera TaxID=29760 RepID=A0A438EC56_VITVI|nr:hypothetical protein CK203_079723 [Vitis vinifera]